MYNYLAHATYLLYKYCILSIERVYRSCGRLYVVMWSYTCWFNVVQGSIQGSIHGYTISIQSRHYRMSVMNYTSTFASFPFSVLYL